MRNKKSKRRRGRRRTRRRRSLRRRGRTKSRRRKRRKEEKKNKEEASEEEEEEEEGNGKGGGKSLHQNPWDAKQMQGVQCRLVTGFRAADNQTNMPPFEGFCEVASASACQLPLGDCRACLPHPPLATSPATLNNFWLTYPNMVVAQ